MQRERFGDETENSETGILLVIDDDPQIRRLGKRFFTPYFAKVLCASDPIAANAILEKERITHLLSELNLESPADGIVFLTFWRREFGSIVRAVLVTATETEGLHLPEEVDAIVSKTAGIDAMLSALFGKGTERSTTHQHGARPSSPDTTSETPPSLKNDVDPVDRRF